MTHERYNLDPETLLERNDEWAREKQEKDPAYFARHVDGQEPPFLFIGCADSRVSPNAITRTQAGQLFTVRNVANQVSAQDLSGGASIEYAVSVLKVSHAVVCGHSGCGGVRAALGATPTGGVIGRWLDDLRETFAEHRELGALSEEEREAFAVELNVRTQLAALARNDAVRRAWDAGSELTLHGWVYDLEQGRLREVAATDGSGPVIVPGAGSLLPPDVDAGSSGARGWTGPPSDHSRSGVRADSGSRTPERSLEHD